MALHDANFPNSHDVLNGALSRRIVVRQLYAFMVVDVGELRDM